MLEEVTELLWMLLDVVSDEVSRGKHPILGRRAQKCLGVNAMMFAAYLCVVDTITDAPQGPTCAPLHPDPHPHAFTTLLSVSMAYAYVHTRSLAGLFWSPPLPSP